jgi:uncharacterized protein (TIGR03000 family)
MSTFVTPAHRQGDRATSRRYPILVSCLAAALPLWWAGEVAAEDNPGAMKGYALQEYLKAQRWKSIPRPAPAAPFVYPQRSLAQVCPLPYPHPEPEGRAYVTAHLPPGAALWVEDVLMVSEATKPEYELRTPPLTKGSEYPYRFRIQWVEDDKWVTQAHTATLKVGDIVCVEIVPNNTAALERDVADSLAKLAPTDRKAAEAQKFCAVQDTIRLGAMGTPVKLTLNGTDVYLCCEGCRAAALRSSEKTVQTAKANKEKPLKSDDKK